MFEGFKHTVLIQFVRHRTVLVPNIYPPFRKSGS